MLPKTTLERLQSFKLTGFVDALIAQMSSTAYQDLSFEDRLTLLIDSEYTRRLDARTRRMLKDAKLPNSATIEELDFSIQRGLQKRVVLELAQGNWLAQGTNLIITGQTGTGKTYLVLN
jgi:DNA replication protein DnaC